MERLITIMVSSAESSGIDVVVVVVVLLFYLHGKHLRSWRDGHLT